MMSNFTLTEIQNIITVIFFILGHALLLRKKFSDHDDRVDELEERNAKLTARVFDLEQKENKNVK